MKLQDYQDIRDCKDASTFEKRLVRFANAMDFGIVSAALAVERPGKKTSFEMIGNTPAGFVEASRSMENTQRDPVHRRLKSSRIPFTYDQSLYVDEDAADLWENQAPFGYRTGIAMALHLPEGMHFLLGVDRAEPLPKADAPLMRLMADLQLLAVYAQETAVRVLGGSDAPAEPTTRLSPREIEVLQWTRDGKSAWVIGQILKLSTPTVNFHLRNASHKLGVPSKHMAVLKAMTLRLI
jgi:DNA-binding CsgD family transcriptional regulator